MQTSPYQHKVRPGSSHTIIVNLLQQFSPGTTILDIGTASGFLAENCKNFGFKFRGVERVNEWANMARPFYQEIFTGSLENTPDDFLKGNNVVICADVLEHMADPEVQLARLVSLQPTGAVFLISVPNIANIWVRLRLLAGKFDYSERGILDRSHLRFFTQQTIIQMVENAGLKVERIIPSSIPLELIHSFFSQSVSGRAIHNLLTKITQLFPTLLGYQFILKAVKPFDTRT